MIETTADGFRVTGALTIETATAVLAEAREAVAHLDAAHPCVVDLAGVDPVDSAAVSVLLSWRRKAHRDGGSIRFVNLPAALASVAALYDVEDLLVR